VLHALQKAHGTIEGKTFMKAVCRTSRGISIVTTAVQAGAHLYCVRWQGEPAIKGCKSLLDLDTLRAMQDSPLADLWLHGKLLCGLLVDTRMRRTLEEEEWEKPRAA
jgi:hypothetical protein